MSNSVTIESIGKQEILDSLFASKIIAVIRVDQPGDLVNVSKALLEGGVKFVEITMTVPNALKAIEETVEKLGSSIHIGAGTVLAGLEASDAISAGASYIVSPILNQEIVGTCNDAEVAVMPGCMTPTEIYNAWSSGADVVKVFPAGVGGSRFFKDIKGPFPDIKIMPTGGVDLNNAGEFINAGACAVGVGAALVSKELIAKKQYKQITENARKFRKLVASSTTR